MYFFTDTTNSDQFQNSDFSKEMEFSEQFVTLYLYLWMLGCKYIIVVNTIPVSIVSKIRA